MNGLEFIGHMIYAVIGFLLGASVMYVGPIIVEAIDERMKEHELHKKSRI